MVVGIFAIFGSTIWFFQPQPTHSIGFQMPPSAQSVQTIPSGYNIQSEIKVAPMVQKRLDKIVFSSQKNITPFIYLNGQAVYINEKVLKRLRGGDMGTNATIVAISIIVYLIYITGVDAYSILQHLTRFNAPTISPGSGPAVCPSTQSQAVPTRAQQFNEMLKQFNDPNCQYVMTREEALKLMAEMYPGELKISDNERISEWQAVKHIYHGIGLGVNPEDYGMTQEQAMKISEPGGIVSYVRRGHQLPSIEHVNAYQKALQDVCENSSKRTNSKYYYEHGVIGNIILVFFSFQ